MCTDSYHPCSAEGVTASGNETMRSLMVFRVRDKLQNFRISSVENEVPTLSPEILGITSRGGIMDASQSNRYQEVTFSWSFLRHQKD